MFKVVAKNNTVIRGVDMTEAYLYEKQGDVFVFVGSYAVYGHDAPDSAFIDAYHADLALQELPDFD